MKRSQADCGFALVEVLVAVVVLSLGLVSATTAMRAGARIHHVGRQRLRACYLLEEKLAVLATASAIDYGLTRGQGDPPYNDLQWECMVRPVALPYLEDQSLAEATLSVTFASRPQPRQVQAVRLVPLARADDDTSEVAEGESP